MSFGLQRAMVESHVATLHCREGRARSGNRRSGLGRHRREYPSILLQLRSRIGLGLVEVGLHLMVRAGGTRPAPYEPALLRRSSAARGR
jgi:hypothetical protein